MTVYDQKSQKVYFFVGGKILVLFKDILYNVSTNASPNSGKSPWSVYTTLHPNQFNSVAAKYLIDPVAGSNYQTTLFGDAFGGIYDMSGVGVLGDGGAYQIDMMRKTRMIDLETIRPWPYVENILAAKVQYRRQIGSQLMNMLFDWTDDLNQSVTYVNLKGQVTGETFPAYGGTSYFGGGSYWNQSPFIANVITHQDCSPTGKGPGFFLTMRCTSNYRWRVDHVEFY
jgi:hypothetical protein